MSDEKSLPFENPNTYSTAELVIFDCPVEYPPFETNANGSTSSTVPNQTVQFVLLLAAESLPGDERRIIKLFLDGKNIHDITKELAIAHRAIYELWRAAYMHTKSFLECNPAVDPELRHSALVEMSRFLNGN